MNKVVKRIICPGASTPEVREFCNRILGQQTDGWSASLWIDVEAYQAGSVDLEPTVMFYDNFSGSIEQAELMLKLKWS
jgi:hypothetical protein